ncbi:DUF4097 family beta strand repeat-containing protein [Paenibacillus sp. EC2-1]|uniref:DUF4097 family beta strand repeat-containing protein n=1 Tax=Paenibacillus sp. EC2-1 TaxID=3388665 RepID=UPI003BEEB531
MRHKFLVSTAILLILIGVVGMAAYKFKFQDKYPDHKQTWTLQANELKKLSILSDYDMDISFTTTSSQEGYIEFEGTVHPKVVEHLRNLTFNGPDFSIDLTPPSTMEFFSVNFTFPKAKIIVALPQGAELDNLNVSSYSAHINIEGATSNNIEVSSLSGDISVLNITANHLKLDTMSGNIEGDTLTADAEITSRSGDIDLLHVQGDAIIDNASGNISIGQHGVASINAKTLSGDIDITVDPEFNGLYEAHTLSGSVNVPTSLNEGQQKVIADSQSGDIDIRLP